MSKWGRYIKSSFADLCCGDTGQTTQPNPDPQPVLKGWRALSYSRSCVQINGLNTGYVHVVNLEEYYLATGLPTGEIKNNVPSDPDYIPDYIDTNLCAVAQPEPTVTYELSVANHSDGVVNVHMEHSDGVTSYDIVDIAKEGIKHQNVKSGTYSFRIGGFTNNSKGAGIPSIRINIGGYDHDYVNNQFAVLSGIDINAISNINISKI